MIKNNIEVDVKIRCIEEGKTQAQIAAEIETMSQYVNRIIKSSNKVIIRHFIQMMEPFRG